MTTIEGIVPINTNWTPIPGTFFEMRGISKRNELDYQVDYGFSPTPDPLRGHDLKLTSYGRVILSVTVNPEDRDRGGVVADITHHNIGLITVRWGFETPYAPPKPKPAVSNSTLFSDPAEKAYWDKFAADAVQRWGDADEDTRAIVRAVGGWDAYDRGVRPGPAQDDTWAALFESGEDLPDWLQALKDDGFTVDDIKAVLDEEDGYTPKSARPTVVDLDEDDFEDEREMSLEEFQRYMARKAEAGN